MGWIPKDHVKQPAGSRLCGQCCVAMIAGVSLEKAIEVVGHAGGTHLYELTAALKELGVRVKSDRKFERFPMRPDVNVALVRLRCQSTYRSHWAIWTPDDIFDPNGRCVCWPAVSYLEVEPVNGKGTMK